MQSVRFVSVMTATAALCLFMATIASGAGVLYDDFSATQIDETKWKYLDYVREVQNGQFVSSMRSYGISQNAKIQSPGNPNSIEAVVTLEEITADDVKRCVALIGQHVFNDCLDCEEDDGTGEIWAEIAIGEFYGELKAQWEVDRYDESNEGWKKIGEGYLGDIAMNMPYKLQMYSDKETGTLVFAVDDDTAYYSLAGC